MENWEEFAHNYRFKHADMNYPKLDSRIIPLQASAEQRIATIRKSFREYDNWRYDVLSNAFATEAAVLLEDVRENIWQKGSVNLVEKLESVTVTHGIAGRSNFGYSYPGEGYLRINLGYVLRADEEALIAVTAQTDSRPTSIGFDFFKDGLPYRTHCNVSNTAPFFYNKADTIDQMKERVAYNLLRLVEHGRLSTNGLN